MRYSIALLPLAFTLSGPAFAQESFVEIPWIAVSPTPDGTISPGEYEGAYSLALDGLEPSVNPGWNPFSDQPVEKEDLSFTFYLAHDGTALYVAFDVTDDHASSVHFPHPNKNGVSLWEDDCTEVFIDGDFDRDNPSEGSGAGQHTLDREWAEGMIPHYGFPDNTYWDNGFRRYGESGDGWYARTTVVGPTAWQAEYRFPLAGIDTLDGAGHRALAVGDVFGLNLLVNDADHGKPRAHQLAWHGATHDDQLYRQQDAWVAVKLAAPPATGGETAPPSKPEEAADAAAEGKTVEAAASR